jgi:5-formyltetrahydrofolate cyclo-ligase
MNKNELRKYFRSKREHLSDKVLKKKSKILNKKIIGSIEYKKAKTIFCYFSFGKEIDTKYLILHSLKLNKTVCIPVIIDKKKMIASKICSIENLIKNKYGIFETDKILEIKKKDIDLIIVPALAFNTRGFRIGYGAGYYDDFLKDYKGTTFGMALKDFLSSEFIPDSHDVPVTKLFIV